MMRFLGFTLRLAIAAAVLLWLIGQPGEARIVWRDHQIETSAAFLVLLIVFAAFVLFEIFRMWRLVREGPRFWRLRNRINRLEKGQSLIGRGLAAIAGGDAAEAGRLAVAARRLLGATASTRLLQAQAARLAGDHRAAREIYRVMAADPESAALGYRGLVMSAVRSGDWDEAERHIEALRQLKPDMPWLNLMRFELAVRRRNWNEAVEALSAAATARLIDGRILRRHQAALFLAVSANEASQGNHTRALQYAEKALKSVPDWLPAFLTLADRQLTCGHYRAALRTIQRGWKIEPHPQLAELYIRAGRRKNALEIHKHMEILAGKGRETPAGRLALAATAMEADLWGEARRHLMALAGQGMATQGVYRMLAKLERRESGDEKGAYQWLMRASEAPPDPRWLCASCDGGHKEWQAACPHCGSFNTLEWRIPGSGRGDGVKALITGPLDMA